VSIGALRASHAPVPGFTPSVSRCSSAMRQCNVLPASGSDISLGNRPDWFTLRSPEAVVGRSSCNALIVFECQSDRLCGNHAPESDQVTGNRGEPNLRVSWALGLAPVALNARIEPARRQAAIREASLVLRGEAPASSPGTPSRAQVFECAGL